MFSSFMLNTWIVATMVAVVAGAVGFFIVLRGSAFVADAVPQGAFAGAAGRSSDRAASGNRRCGSTTCHRSRRCC